MEGFSSSNTISHILLYYSNIFSSIISFELSTDAFTIFQTGNDAIKEDMNTFNNQGQSRKLIGLWTHF